MTIRKILLIQILICASLVGIECKSTHTARSQEETFKAIYVDQFKLTYFRQILKKGFNNSRAIQEILNSDHSGFAEPVLSEGDYALIDSLTTAHNELMKMDSTIGDRRAEGAQGKRPLGFILNKLDSKWLDSVAKQRLLSSNIPKSWFN